MKEKKARVEDALHATRAAVEEGIVPGGGVAFIRAQKALDNVQDLEGDEKVGVQIVRRAIEEPTPSARGQRGPGRRAHRAGSQGAQRQRRLQRRHRRIRPTSSKPAWLIRRKSPARVAKRGLDLRPVAHHRSHRDRDSGEGKDSSDARRRNGWHGRNGLLIREIN